MHYKKTFPTPAEHSAGKNSCQYIVLHHTATKEGTINGVLDGLYRRPDFASCHYCIDINGDVYKIGKDTDILWHAGVSSWKGLTDMNKYSIGIEVIGPLSNGGFTDEQREAIQTLVTELCDTHKIPQDRLIRHKDIAPKRKTDIADTLWNGIAPSWEVWRERLFTPTKPPVVAPTVSSWAVSAVNKAKAKGVASSWDNPQEPLNPVDAALMLYRVGLLDTDPKGKPLTKEQFAVVLDRLGKLDF